MSKCSRRARRSGTGPEQKRPPPCLGCSGPRRANGSIVHDPLYIGPAGHAPPDVCWECYLGAELVLPLRMVFKGRPARGLRSMEWAEVALVLHGWAGLTFAEVDEVIGQLGGPRHNRQRVWRYCQLCVHRGQLPDVLELLRQRRRLQSADVRASIVSVPTE